MQVMVNISRAKITIKDIGMEHTVSGTIKMELKVALTRESVIEALKTIQGPKGQDIVTGGEVELWMLVKKMCVCFRN